jgi:hypothetical protein
VPPAGMGDLHEKWICCSFSSTRAIVSIRTLGSKLYRPRSTSTGESMWGELGGTATCSSASSTGVVGELDSRQDVVATIRLARCVDVGPGYRSVDAIRDWIASAQFVRWLVKVVE